MSRILVTGGTGFVGTHLCLALKNLGHEVFILSRNSVKNAPYPILCWDGNAMTPISVQHSFDAVVNLAGANLSDGRWTPKRKEILRASRIQYTSNLIEALSQQKDPPKVLVSMSGIGIYGNGGNDFLTEAHPLDSRSFLGQLAQDWESSARSASHRWQARVVLMRAGVILHPNGGVWAKLAPLFRNGIGGPLGSGNQWMSCIYMDDLVRMICAAIEDERWSGPVNAVCCTPVQNHEFSKCFAAFYNKKTRFAVPSFALQIAMGQMAQELLLFSQRALPTRALACGFQHAKTDVNEIFSR